jgi:hypothetical protein
MHSQLIYRQPGPAEPISKRLLNIYGLHGSNSCLQPVHQLLFSEGGGGQNLWGGGRDKIQCFVPNVLHLGSTVFSGRQLGRGFLHYCIRIIVQSQTTSRCLRLSARHHIVIANSENTGNRKCAAVTRAGASC